MATSRVETFAAELKLDVDVLLEQLKTAGVDKSSGADLLSESDKEKLLEALRKAHGGSADAPRRKITITKRQPTKPSPPRTHVTGALSGSRSSSGRCSPRRAVVTGISCAIKI